MFGTEADRIALRPYEEGEVLHLQNSIIGAMPYRWSLATLWDKEDLSVTAVYIKVNAIA